MNPEAGPADPGSPTLFLLDTDVLIDVCRGREPVATWVRSLPEQGHALCCCDITIAEYYSGEARGAYPRRDALVSSLLYLETPVEVAEVAGKFRHTFAARGIALSTQDVLIAATAAHHGAVVLTRNVKDFPMDDVRVMSQAGA